MRFHIGFSKRISWKWIIGAIGIIAALFFGNHVALAATLSADATQVYVRSPMYDVNSPAMDAGGLMYYDSATPYYITWSSQRYSAFQTTVVGSSKYLAYGDHLLKSRLRWVYATSDMSKCSSSQAIQYEFQFYLRDVSGSIPNTTRDGVSSRWNYPGLFSRVWIRSSSTNYDCSILSRESNIMRVQCTIPNPTAVVYVYLEDFTAFYPIAAQDTLFNVGLAPIQYTCTGLDSAGIINSVTNSAQTIIENNYNNTQQIIDSQQQIQDSLTDNSIQSSTTNDASSIFSQDPFQNHGIQAIITAPISMLQGILNASTGTCQNLAVPVNLTGTDTATYLPCGSMLWSRVPSTIEAIYQTTIYGFLIYFVLADIVRTVNAVLDPERKNDYVMDL